MFGLNKTIFLNYKKYICHLFPKTLGFFINNELIIKAPLDYVNKLIYFLNKHTNSQFHVLIDFTAADYPYRKNRFELIYNLLSLQFNSRITLSCFIAEMTLVPSIINIHEGAGWWEREVWDMFGIFFFGNNDLRRILTDYGFVGHPLRKDFPLVGFTESRYSDLIKMVNYGKVSLFQEYRIFTFNNNWSV